MDRMAAYIMTELFCFIIVAIKVVDIFVSSYLFWFIWTKSFWAKKNSIRL